MEIDQSLFELAKEEYGIFLKWRAAFGCGNAKIDSHPALPADRSRFDELKAKIANRLALVPNRAITKRARFSRDSGADPTLAQWHVEWSAA